MAKEPHIFDYDRVVDSYLEKRLAALSPERRRAHGRLQFLVDALYENYESITKSTPPNQIDSLIARLIALQAGIIGTEPLPSEDAIASLEKQIQELISPSQEE
jgi:hypothetical protein